MGFVGFLFQCFVLYTWIPCVCEVADNIYVHFLFMSSCSWNKVLRANHKKRKGHLHPTPLKLSSVTLVLVLPNSLSNYFLNSLLAQMTQKQAKTNCILLVASCDLLGISELSNSSDDYI